MAPSLPDSPLDHHEDTIDGKVNTGDDHSTKAKKSPLEMISQGVCLPGIPQHPTFQEHRQWMLEKMALAFRVFARKGYTDGLAGHISVRDPEWPHTFWTNPLAKHYGLMKASDMILVDYSGKPVGGNTSLPANGAGFQIHSAIHKRRPDVAAAAHTHSPYGLAWSPFGRPLEMLTQDAAYLYDDAQGVYDDFGGVVFTEEEGERIGNALGPKGKGLMLRNHGLLTVGNTVDEACFLMTLMERCCQVQLLAEAAAANGVPKTYLSDEAARYTFEMSSTPETLYWEAQPDLEFEAHMCNGEHRG
ncbi:arad-like aldolase/epimerase [Hortaea werneckii]|nr:arad-like aldolase/epimerase [Hortaea werneckii]